MHHFKEVYRMTDNSDTPLAEPFGALYSLKTNAGGETLRSYCDISKQAVSLKEKDIHLYHN